VKSEYTLGAVAMANSGRTPTAHSSSSASRCTRKLDKLYNLFGHVVSGIDVALATTVGDTMKSVVVEEVENPRNASACAVDEAVAPTQPCVEPRETQVRRSRRRR